MRLGTMRKRLGAIIGIGAALVVAAPGMAWRGREHGNRTTTSSKRQGG